MGSSPSIQEMEDKEVKFDEWVKGRMAKVAEESKAARDDLLKKFKDDFDDSDKWLTIRDKYYSDFAHEESFSLANISDIIDKVSGALFGDPGNPKDDKTGVEVTKPQLDPDSIGALAKFSNVEALITAKALNLVSGILRMFDTNASLKGSFQGGIDQLSPGLYMGLSARRTSYTGHSFFNDTSVVETFFVVLVKYSHEAFNSSQQMFTDAETAEQLDKLRNGLGKQLEDLLLKIDPTDDKTFDAVDNAITRYKKIASALESM